MTLEELINIIDATNLGEFLRAAAFPAQNKTPYCYGCYTTFDFPKYAEIFDKKQIEQYWYLIKNKGSNYNEALTEESTEFGRGCKFDIDGYIVECCYYWDGDGTLSFKIYNDSGKLLAIIINTDCKKSYGWEHL